MTVGLTRAAVMRSIALVVLVGCRSAEPPPSDQHTPSKEVAQPADRPTASTTGSSTRVTFGDSLLMLPEGWSEIRREPDRVTFRSADQTEQATISKMDFARAPSFDDFKRLCQHRLDAEKQETKIEPLVTGPSDDAHQYTFLYSGDDKASQRLFSGYMSVVGKTLTTVYLEGIGVTAQRHLESFKAFVSGYRPVHAP